MNNRTKLQSLCVTRWSIRANALYTFKYAFTVVVIALEYLEEDEDGEARGYLLSIRPFDFVITLGTIGHVLQSQLPLTTFLQAKHCDLVEAANEATTVNAQLQQERADPDDGDAWFDSAVELTEKLRLRRASW